ncbi:hypothetical protein [Acinetobacter baumannii]|uniref:hypothetical protein n=1 Tax=Acinetobacter baumannii TaxID=470 RepID=UPI000AB6B359|nr:hypothetical protein [Acinetobacter baumannii]
MPSKQASWFANVNPNVFLGTVIIIALFLAVVVIAPSSFERKRPLNPTFSNSLIPR